jgi:ABC-type branched-subunit amino acid transport system substrate-binding protein
MRLRIFGLVAGLGILALMPASLAQKAYGPGVTDTEIKLGQTQPLSGPASGYAIFGRVEAAYLKMINAAGGINGRKVTLIQLDDAYSPPKTVEQVRKLVEGENVLAIFAQLGTPGNIAISKYLNNNKVPQIFSSSASPKLNDPVKQPWTTVFALSQAAEGAMFGQFLLKNKPDAKVAILFQNDDYGKGYVEGLRKGLGDKASTMMIKELGYELADPTIDSQVVGLRASGADTILLASSPKFAAQAIRKIAEIDWHPLKILASGASQKSTTLRPAGLQNALGALSAVQYKVSGDPAHWKDDKGLADYLAFMKEWLPGEEATDSLPALAYSTAQVLVEVLKNCGDDLTRENLLKQSTNIKDLQLPLFLPGIKVNISPDDYTPWRQAQISRFDGEKYVPVGELVSAPK